MTDITTTARKTDKQFLFEVKLNWQKNNSGIIHADDVYDTLHVATPQKFGGEGREWSPEHLFLSAICSCYMTTFLAFSKKMNFTITHFKCEAIGQIKLINGKYKFTTINVYPKIYIGDELLKEKVSLAIEKTQKYCLVSASVNATILYHSEVINEEKRILEKQDNTQFYK
jgi:peroxiredoxin-like protein